MTSNFNRRQFLSIVAAAAAAPGFATVPLEQKEKPRIKSVFKLSVFTDEISQNFDHACRIAAYEFGLSYVELRAMWDKNIVDLDEKQLATVKETLQKYTLGVTSIAGPLFKVDWKGAPLSKDSSEKRTFNATAEWEKQDKVLDREIQLAKMFNTDHIRCFDFYRQEDPKPFRAAMDAKLQEAAEKAGKNGLTLVMENEHACNTATAAEAARTLGAVKSPFFKLNWDPGNAAFAGEKPYPDGYNLLPKDRIGHVHCKDVKIKKNGGMGWAAMGQGTIDFVGQFEALKKDGYTGPVVLETHWGGGGNEEESTRQSMAGMMGQLRKAGALL